MKILRNTLVIGLMLLTVFSRAYAESKSASLIVSAHVLPTISSTVSHRSPSIVVTPQDVQRGYVDIHRGTVVSVTTNSSSYYLFFENMGGFPATEVWVTAAGRTVILPGGSGIVEEHGKGRSAAETELSYRFMLTGDAAPGIYPWPININAVN